MLEKLSKKQFFSTRSRRLFQIAAYIIATLFIALLVYSAWENRASLQSLLAQANYSQLLGFTAFYLISASACAVNWVAMMHTFDRSLNWWVHTQIYCMTQATRRIPGTLWYVGSRVVIYQKLGLTTTVVLLANAIELIITLVTASTMGILFLLLSKFQPSPLAFIVMIASLAIASLSLRPSVFRWLLKKFGAPPAANLSFRNIATWILLYSLVWIASGLMLNQLVNVFTPGGLDQSLYIIGAWSLSVTAGVLTFFLPTNFGLTELALTVLLIPILPLPLAGMIAIMMRFLTILLEIAVSAAFYLLALKSPPLTDVLRDQQFTDRPSATK